MYDTIDPTKFKIEDIVEAQISSLLVLCLLITLEEEDEKIRKLNILGKSLIGLFDSAAHPLASGGD